MKYIVYQTTNLVNGKIYIGQHKTKNPDVFDQYLGCGIKINMPSSYMNPSSPLQYAVKKYGVKNFKRTTLQVFDTLEEALELEARIVNYDFLKRPDTYNAQLGGKTGYKYLPIYQFDIDGNFIKEWTTMAEASDFYCISHTAIMNAVNYKNCCKGYYWSKEKSINISEFTKIEKKVFCYDCENGKFLECYNSIVEAAKSIGATAQQIGTAVKSGYKVKNYYFLDKLVEEYRGKSKISLKNKTLYVYDLDGNFVIELHNGNAIKEFFNINGTGQITTAIRKGIPYKTWQLSLNKVEKMDKVELKHKTKRPVVVYDEFGNYIEEFSTTKSCIDKYGRTVEKVLKGIQQKYKGYIFKYKE